MIHKLQFLISFILFIIVLAISLFYLAGVENKYTINVVSFLHLPIANIEGQSISTNIFYHLVRAVRANQDNSSLSNDEVKGLAWESLVHDYVLRNLAKDNEIVWTDAELELLLTTMTSGMTSAERRQSIIDLYALPVEQFKQHILLQILLEDRLRAKFMTDNTDPTLQTMARLYSGLKDNTIEINSIETNSEYQIMKLSISDIVLQETEDTELVDLVKPLEIGDITTLITMPQGYHIYHVTNIIGSDTRTWQLKDIYLPSDVFQDTLNRAIVNAEIKLWAKKIIPNI